MFLTASECTEILAKCQCSGNLWLFMSFGGFVSTSKARLWNHSFRSTNPWLLCARCAIPVMNKSKYLIIVSSSCFKDAGLKAGLITRLK